MAYINNTINSQLPGHVVRDYPLFVEFLKAYYEWMESNGQPYYGINKHLDWMNFESSMSDYVQFLRQEYLFNLPSNVAGGLELFLQNSKQFHLAVGTEASFKFIFKILFGTEGGDVELYFPRKDILRVSDSTWTAAQKVIYITDSGNSADFLYRVLKQTKEIFPGVFRYANAIVQRVSDRYAGKFKITELYLTEIQGEFEVGYPVTVDNRSEWIVPTGNLINLTSGGIHYYLDDKVSISGNDTFIQTVTASSGERVDTRISGIFTNSELTVKVNGVTKTNFTYDGRYITQPDIISGSVVQITFPTFGGYIVVSEIGSNGEILALNIIDSPIGLNLVKSLVVTSLTGSGFAATITPQVTRDIPGYYLDDRGQVSSTKVIQDSNYYQEFSYVIKSSLDVDRYKDIVLKLLHPAGMKLFGKVNIIELVKLFIVDAYDIITLPTKSVFLETSLVKLYTDYSYIDRQKNNFDVSIWKSFYFKDMRVGDTTEIDKRHKPLNIQNVHIDITTEYDHLYDVTVRLDNFANVQLPYNLRGTT